MERLRKLINKGLIDTERIDYFKKEMNFQNSITLLSTENILHRSDLNTDTHTLTTHDPGSKALSRTHALRHIFDDVNSSVTGDNNHKARIAQIYFTVTIFDNKISSQSGPLGLDIVYCCKLLLKETARLVVTLK